MKPWNLVCSAGTAWNRDYHSGRRDSLGHHRKEQQMWSRSRVDQGMVRREVSDVDRALWN